jgi:hypothetical protein
VSVFHRLDFIDISHFTITYSIQQCYESRYQYCCYGLYQLFKVISNHVGFQCGCWCSPVLGQIEMGNGKDHIYYEIWLGLS